MLRWWKCVNSVYPILLNASSEKQCNCNSIILKGHFYTLQEDSSASWDRCGHTMVSILLLFAFVYLFNYARMLRWVIKRCQHNWWIFYMQTISTLPCTFDTTKSKQERESERANDLRDRYMWLQSTIVFSDNSIHTEVQKVISSELNFNNKATMLIKTMTTSSIRNNTKSFTF